MQNMFPIKSNLGNARIPVEPDIDIQSMIGDRSSGLQVVSNRMQSNNIGNGRHLQGQTVNPDLKFGGVVNSDPGPGRDILNRARSNAENLWESYKQPAVQAEQMGPSRDELHRRQYFDEALKSRTVDSNIAQNERKIGNEERRLDQADQKIDNTETVNDRRLKVLEEGASAKTDLAKQKLDEATTAKSNQRKAITSRAQAALDELNSLIDDKDTLTTRGNDAFGGINNMISNYWPLSSDSYDASTTRDRLKNLLTLDLIGEMKAQSKTGATGFGAMNLRELGVLEGGASRLNGKLSDKDAPGVLRDLRKKLQDVLTDGPDDADNSTGPKVGDIKDFPNGRKGKWDGYGWEPVQ